MGNSPEDSKIAKSPARRKAANVVSFEEARRRSLKDGGRKSAQAPARTRAGRGLGSRKEFNIARGALREGALYDPNDSPSRPLKQKPSVKAKSQAKAQSKPQARPKLADLSKQSKAAPAERPKLASAKRPKLADASRPKLADSAKRQKAAPADRPKLSDAPRPKASVPRPKASSQRLKAKPKVVAAPRPSAHPEPAPVAPAKRPSAAEQKSRYAMRAEAKRQAREEKRRARTKAKADKQFDKAYGDGPAHSQAFVKKRAVESSRSSASGSGGPRPAVYKGQMGASHKKSTKLQSHGTPSARGLSLPSLKLPTIPRRLSATLVAVLLTAFCAFSLYGPAQQYYTQMRETDRLQAEYAAVAARSNTLQSSIDSLQSDEGIEDKAHADLGYVKAKEQTATVKGIKFANEKQFAPNVVPGSVPAPETWYSPVLDVVFGYSK